MQTPMTFIKFGLTLNYWMLGIPMRVEELSHSYKVKTSFHFVEYIRLVMTLLLVAPFLFYKSGKYLILDQELQGIGVINWPQLTNVEQAKIFICSPESRLIGQCRQNGENF